MPTHAMLNTSGWVPCEYTPRGLTAQPTTLFESQTIYDGMVAATWNTCTIPSGVTLAVTGTGVLYVGKLFLGS